MPTTGQPGPNEVLDAWAGLAQAVVPFLQTHSLGKRVLGSFLSEERSLTSHSKGLTCAVQVRGKEPEESGDQAKPCNREERKKGRLPSWGKGARV